MADMSHIKAQRRRTTGLTRRWYLIPKTCEWLVLCWGLLLFRSAPVFGQAILNADGPGNTYELINSVLAPSGGDVVENPECVHPEFGRHIAEVWDADLGQYVFEFYSHVTPDNDRCINFDRQRIEIKTYDQSPDSLLGTIGETFTYTWKFRLPTGFQPSPNFTHLHQIKAVGGNDGNPLFTLTARKGSPNKLELIHDNTTKVAIVNLLSFEGTWVECAEVMTVGSSGSYTMTIRNVITGDTILSYTNGNIMTIRSDNDFIRPKWGIYRSLLSSSDLRDEAVRFAGFSIKEEPAPLPVSVVDKEALVGVVLTAYELRAYPNPFNPATTIVFTLPVETEVSVDVCDLLGRTVARVVDEIRPAGEYRVVWDATQHASGIYFVRLVAPNGGYARKIVMMK